MKHGARPMRSVNRDRVKNLASESRIQWYSITNKADAPTQIAIYDEIGMWGVSATSFMDELSTVKGDIELHVNSPGGDVFDGIAIFNRLVQHQAKGNVHVIVDGLAASAASFIAMAASKGQLEMAPRSQLMIHDGFAMAIGNAADMRELADQLDSVSDDIASIYAERAGKPVEHFRALMQKETWLKPAQAIAEGLADRIHGESDDPQDSWDMSVFQNAASEEDPAAGGNVCKTCEGKGRLPHPVTGNQGKKCPSCKGSGTYDPDHDGDDDSTAAGDTDHDYVKPDGSPGPKAKPGKNKSVRHWLNADKYKQADRDRMAESGEAMPDGSYPIADAEDLDNAVQAVGRGNADHDDIRKHIIKRADALSLSSKVPDNWNADGSLKDSSGSPDDMADGSMLAALFGSLAQIGGN